MLGTVHSHPITMRVAERLGNKMEQCPKERHLAFRLAEHKDTSRVLALLNETFRTPTNAAVWQWFTTENPFGRSRVYVADDGNPDVVAGAFAFSPVAARLNGQPLRVTHGHHLAIHPRYRGGPAFVGLSRYALSREEECGIQAVVGLLNTRSYGPQKVLMKWTDFGLLDQLYKPEPVPRQHVCRQADSFPVGFDPFYDRVSEKLSFHCHKTRAWMNWRFCGRPDSPYAVYIMGCDHDVQGYVVLKRWRDPDGTSKTHVIDLHAMHKEAFGQLVAAAESWAFGSREVNLWSMQNYAYGELAAECGFLRRSAPPQPLAVRSLGATVMQPGGLTSFSYGDGDLLY